MSGAPDESAAPAQPGVSTDPFRAYNFAIDINGVNQGHFVQCTGMAVSVDCIDYREAGSDPQTIIRVPGRVRYANVTFKYGLTASQELWQWFWAGVSGTADRRNVTVRLLGTDGSSEVARWELINAWVSEWEGTPLDAMGNEIAVESMTIVFERLER